MLRKRTDGAISLWLVDPNLNAVTSRVYGPVFGWVPVSLFLQFRGPFFDLILKYALVAGGLFLRYHG